MADNLLQYSGLVTKTRGMHGRLLKEEEYDHVMEYSNVEDVISFLRESKGYATTYQSHEEIHHRAQVEAVLHESLGWDFEKLYQFSNGEQRMALNIIFLRYEINQLKHCLQWVYHVSEREEHRYLVRSPFFEKHCSYASPALAAANTMQEILTAVAGTPYEPLLIRLQGTNGIPYGECATQLDIYYYKKVWKEKDKFKDKNLQKILTGIFGTEVDWMNILWIYRSKRFFRMSSSDLLAGTIPVEYRLKKTEVQQMVEADSVEGFLTVLGKTSYFSGKDAVAAMGDEVTYKKIMDKVYDSLSRKYPNSMAPVLRYLYDKENEIELLTTILEGIRYQVPPKDIRDMIVITR